jgi:hypothetical protein
MPTSTARSAYGFSSSREVHWTTRGLCQANPDMWVSERNGKLGDRDHVQAVHICRVHCPVFEECAKATMDPIPRVGVQAGILWRKPPDAPGPELRQPPHIRCDAFCYTYREEVINA